MTKRGGQAEQKRELHGPEAGSQTGERKKQGPTRTDPVRADSCLSGFWSMPCDSIPAAPSQRFLHSAAFSQLSVGSRLRCRPAACRLVAVPDPGFTAGLPRRPAAGLPPNLPWGENPTRRRACGIGTGRGNFNYPGGGCKEPRRRGPGPPCAQASADFLHDQRRRSDLFLLISAAVLREWQLWHRLWRLLASVNAAQSPLWSRMWSTSVALVRMPC